MVYKEDSEVSCGCRSSGHVGSESLVHMLDTLAQYVECLRKKSPLETTSKSRKVRGSEDSSGRRGITPCNGYRSRYFHPSQITGLALTL